MLSWGSAVFMGRNGFKGVLKGLDWNFGTVFIGYGTIQQGFGRINGGGKRLCEDFDGF